MRWQLCEALPNRARPVANDAVELNRLRLAAVLARLQSSVNNTAAACFPSASSHETLLKMDPACHVRPLKRREATRLWRPKRISRVVGRERRWEGIGSRLIRGRGCSSRLLRDLFLQYSAL